MLKALRQKCLRNSKEAKYGWNGAVKGRLENRALQGSDTT